MTRKDTLIIAVLVNCALLLALFISALKRDFKEQELSTSTREALKPLIEVPVAKVEISTAQGDEVDKVLQEFSQEQVTGKQKEASIEFVRDLKALLPPASEEKVVQESKREVEVTVRKGDALEKIAKSHNTTTQEIINLNRLTSTTLQIGQKLRVIPGKTTPLVREAKPPVEEETYYVVKKGDTPWAIAIKNRIKMDQLLKLNGLDEEKARHLKPGRRLRIR